MLMPSGLALFRKGGLTGLCTACIFTLASAAGAQTVGDISGGIDGILTDRTGGALPGVLIRATSPALMGARTSVSGSDGAYRFDGLPPGEYELAFSLPAFHPAVRHGVHVASGATTSVMVTLDVASLQEEVTVESGVRVLDRHSTAIATRVSSETLVHLPGARSMGALLAAAPAVQLTRFDVGGHTAFAMGVFSAYGISGFNRPTVEGISVSGLNPFGFTLDYGSFEQVVIRLAAHGPEWPSPGVHVQVVTKSGGNRYRGSLYAGYSDGGWQARNIDAGQIARGAVSAAGFPPEEANRLTEYRDVNGDIGGYVRRDRLWWYLSARTQGITARRVTFPAEPIENDSRSAAGKMTLRVANDSNIVVFGQRGRASQPVRLDGFLRGESAVNESVASTTDQLAEGLVWKTEWNAAIARRVFIEARLGQFAASRAERPNGAAPRFEDLVSPFVRGGNRDWEVESHRNQINGSLSYISASRFGQHHLKAGGEVQHLVGTESWKQGYPGDVLHVLNNGSAAEVYLFQTPSRSSSGQRWYTGYINDSWQVNSRLTLNLGLRFERFRVFLPAQEHPAGRFNPAPQTFPAVHNVIDWAVAAPRVGASYDLTGAARTILKSSYGRYWLPPDSELGFEVNQNARTWWERFRWTDANQNTLWDAGEESDLPLERRGGSTSESIDPGLRLAYVHELTVGLEREFAGGIRGGTGLVWRGERQQRLRQRKTWDFDAFTIATIRRDPGPAGGTLDPPGTGPGIPIHELPAGAIGEPEFVVRNVPRSHSDYLTWEITADKRFERRWSLAGGFAYGWHRDNANAYFGQTVRANTFALTPNDLLHTDAGGRHVFNVWSAKLHATFEAPWQLRVTPFLRHQSGQPYGRTIVATLNTGNIRLLAEPIGTRRQDHIALFDVALEKPVAVPGGRLAVFLEIFNVFNSNAEQNINWASGPLFLRPLTIVPPRIARIGLRFDW